MWSVQSNSHGNGIKNQNEISIWKLKSYIYCAFAKSQYLSFSTVKCTSIYHKGKLLKIGKYILKRKYCFPSECFYPIEQL